MKAIDAAIDRIDLMAQLADIHERQDPLAAHRLVTELLLGQAPKSRMNQVRVQPTADAIRAGAVTTRRTQPRSSTRRALGHIGGDLSAADILATLYLGVLHVDPDQPDDPERDRYIQSKGHCVSGVLYTTLAAAGFYPGRPMLGHLHAADGSRLNGHPGPQQGAGRRGQHRPARPRPADRASASAIAAKLDDRRLAHVRPAPATASCRRAATGRRPWPAPTATSTTSPLIVDRNRLQQGARTEATNALDPLDARSARAFGWAVTERRRARLSASCSPRSRPLPFERGRPSCVIAHTRQGPGRLLHRGPRRAGTTKVPVADELDQALGRARGAGRMSQRCATAGRRSPSTLIDLAAHDERIVAVVNDTRRLLQARAGSGRRSRSA